MAAFRIHQLWVLFFFFSILKGLVGKEDESFKSAQSSLDIIKSSGEENSTAVMQLVKVVEFLLNKVKEHEGVIKQQNELIETLKQPPQILRKEVNITRKHASDPEDMIFDKDTVTLSCVASGYFPLNMTWIGPNEQVESPDCLTTDIAFNTRELICPVQVSKDDDGKYMCTATSYGGNNTANITLNVNSEVSIAKADESNITLTCDTEKDGAYVWTNENENTIDSETNSSLTILVRKYHNYESTVHPPIYSCHPKNDTSKKKYFSLEVHYLAEESEFNCSKTEDVYTCQFECYGGPNIKPTVSCSRDNILPIPKDSTNIWNITYSPKVSKVTTKENVSEVVPMEEVVACTFSFNNVEGKRFIANFPEAKADPCSDFGCQYNCKIDKGSPKCLCGDGEQLAANNKSCEILLSSTEITDSPATTDSSATVDTSVTTDTPVTTDSSATVDTSVTTDTPVTTDSSATVDTSVTTDTPVTTDSSATVDTSVTTDTPVTTNTSVTTDKSESTTKPTNTNTSSKMSSPPATMASPPAKTSPSKDGASKVTFVAIVVTMILILVFGLSLVLAYKNRYAIRSWIMEEKKLPAIIRRKKGKGGNYKYSRLPTRFTGGSKIA